MSPFACFSMKFVPGLDGCDWLARALCHRLLCVCCDALEPSHLAFLRQLIDYTNLARSYIADMHLPLLGHHVPVRHLDYIRTYHFLMCHKVRYPRDIHLQFHIIGYFVHV